MLNQKRSLKILIIPSIRNPYNQRMVNGLAKGFQIIGHDAKSLPGPLSAIHLTKICESISVDIVIQVNKARHPGIPLPKNVRFISWYQDVFPKTLIGFEDGFQESDILYALGDPFVLGLNMKLPCYVGSLLTGVEQSIFKYRKNTSSNKIDFSLCGFIPRAIYTKPTIKLDLLWYWDSLIDRIPLLGKSKIFWIIRRLIFRQNLPVQHVPYAVILALKDIVEGIYQPLGGNLDINFLSDAMHNSCTLFYGKSINRRPKKLKHKKQSRRSMLLQPYPPSYAEGNDLKSKILKFFKTDGIPGPYYAIESAINYYTQTYPRLLDRVTLINEILQVSNSLELYGPGWNTHPSFIKYHKGIINDQDKLLDIYLRSRINLANNTHGLGLHSRTLECMAVGGFIFSHKSPHDNKLGGMMTSFEPGVHYGVCTPENLREEAMRWLKNGKKRRQAGALASSIIREKHMWHHRAQQIIEDIKRK